VPPVDRLNPTRAPSSESSCYLLEFMREFPDDEACLQHVWRERFAPDGDHALCPRCETERTFKRYPTKDKRPAWYCQTCGHRTHPLKGTIFEKSSTSLFLWFYAMYLITSTRCGISAKHLGTGAWGDVQDRMEDVQQDSEPAHGRRTMSPCPVRSRLTRRSSAERRTTTRSATGPKSWS
jgi:hypothetical protein